MEALEQSDVIDVFQQTSNPIKATLTDISVTTLLREMEAGKCIKGHLYGMLLPWYLLCPVEPNAIYRKAKDKCHNCDFSQITDLL